MVESPRNPLDTRLGRPRASLDAVERTKNPCPLSEIEPSLLCHAGVNFAITAERKDLFPIYNLFVSNCMKGNTRV
jgi:hypothetical protein